MVSGDVIYLSRTRWRQKKSLQTGPTDIYIIRRQAQQLGDQGYPRFSPTPGMPAESTSRRRTGLFPVHRQAIQDSMRGHPGTLATKNHARILEASAVEIVHHRTLPLLPN